MRWKRRGAGFTLIELCVVCGVLAVLFLFSLTSFRGFLGQNYLNLYKRQMVSALRQARQAAVQSGNVATVRFFKKKAGSPAYYQIYAQSPRGDEVIIRTATLPFFLDFAADKEISFAASSFCLPAYFGTINLLSVDGKTREIVVSSLGRVR